MEFIPIPYFGMIVSLIIAPTITFGFILILKKIDCVQTSSQFGLKGHQEQSVMRRA